MGDELPHSKEGFLEEVPETLAEKADSKTELSSKVPEHSSSD